MSILIPLVGAVLQAGSSLLDKFILNIRGIGPRIYMGIGFPILFVIMAVIMLVVRPPFSLSLLGGQNGILLIISIAILIAGNFLHYRALDTDEAQEIQIVDLIRNIPVIVVNGLIFADERDPAVFFAAVIASFAIWWSHHEHHRFVIRKRTFTLLLLAITLSPLSAAISKILLYNWNPISLEFVRCAALALVFGPLYARSTHAQSARVTGLLALTNLLTAVAWILAGYGYQTIGVVYTLLIFSLQPFVVYLGAVAFLGERFHAKKFAAFVVVLVSILAARLR